MFSSPFPKEVGFAAISIDTTATIASFKEKISLQELEIAETFGSQKRQKEFLFGRMAAHQALSHLSEKFQECSIRKGEQGQPLWPENSIGSITHSDTWAIAAAAQPNGIKTIGIDLQSFKRPLRYDISKYVCQESETLWAKEIESKSHERIISIFSAKESIYKAIFPLHQHRLRFKDIALSWKDELQGFSALIAAGSETKNSLPSFLEVGCRTKDGYVFSYVIL